MSKFQSPMFGRRSFLKATALTSGAFFINTRYSRACLAAPPASPPTTPWLQPLAFAPYAVPLAQGLVLDPVPDPARFQRYDEFRPRKFYEISARTVMARPHPQLGLTEFMSYGGSVPGVTFMCDYSTPMMVRFKNELPHELTGFGEPEMITHVHNGNNAPESDGFPTEHYGPGYYKDHHYPNYPAGGDPNQRKGTLWYHDHTHDYTAANTYRGLAGFYFMFDERDSGNENDPSPDAFRLPSGIPNGGNGEGCYDIPMAFADRQFDQNGILTMDPLDMDGTIGDKWLVNGRVQPYFNVKRRKYRFRWLDAGPARFYDLAFSNGMEFQVIATDGNMLPAPLTLNGVKLGPGERFDIVVDFAKLPASTTELYIVNRAVHATGRGPTGQTLPLNRAEKFLKIVVQPGAVADPSRVPTTLRTLPPMNLTGAVRRTWHFDRAQGMWTMNGKVFDEATPGATIVQGRPEIWTFSTSGGWAHPAHFHVEEGRMLSYNGVPINGGLYGGRKDVFALYGGDQMEVALTYHDWIGRYVMHCHNGVHEDHGMMTWLNIVAPS